MINLTESEKNEYKDYNREIKVFGNLYLARKKASKNLFDYRKTPFYYSKTETILNHAFKVTNTEVSNSTYCAIKLEANKVLGKTIYFKADYESTSKYPAIYLIGTKNNLIVGSNLAGDTDNNSVNGRLEFSYTFPNTLPSNYDDYALLFYCNTNQRTDAEVGDYTLYGNIMVSDNANDKYEEYGQIINDYSLTSGVTSNNLLPFPKFTREKNNEVWIDCFSGTYVFNGGENNQSTNVTFQIEPITLNAGGYTFSKGGDVKYENPRVKLLNSSHQVVVTLTSENYKSFILNSNTTITDIQFEFIGGEYNKSYTLMLNSGNKPLPYERYGSTPFKLTEENECKILGFNILEKSDIYYTSLPYNTMSITVDNEKGYFTVEDEDNILGLLNTDCYVDLFMKINDNSYNKIMTMNLDKLSYTDYKKAKLDFSSCISKINSVKLLLDRNKDDGYGYSYEDILNDLYLNYNVACCSNHWKFRHGTIDSSFSMLSRRSQDLKSIILYGGTTFGISSAGCFTTTDYNNNLFYKEISNIEKENITQSLQLEKPIVKNDNIYKNIKFTEYNSYEEDTFEQTSMTYSKQFLYKLKTEKDIFLFTDYNYKIGEITSNDIQASNNVSVNVEQLTMPTTENYVLRFIVEGNINEDYSLKIEKENIKRYVEDKSTAIYSFKTDVNSEDKTLIINLNAPSSSGIYDFIYIKKPIVSNIEANIMGLPYLEIGDTINIQLENKVKKIVITDINSNFDGGFTQTIKGYEFDWTHLVPESSVYSDLNGWDRLLPRSDLYPSSTVYPNMIIN